MKKRQWLSLFLVLFLLVPSLSFATDSSSNYLQTALPKHVQAMKSLDPSFNTANDLAFGVELPVYSAQNGSLSATDVKYVTVFSGGRAIAYIAVSKTDAGEWTSGFGKMFLEEAQNAGIADKLNEYTLVKVSGKLIAAKGDSAVILSESLEPSSVNMKNIQELVGKKSKMSFRTLGNANKKTYVKMAATRASSKMLDVKVVLQNGKPICWAAACAAVINYVKGESLTAEKVAQDMGVTGGAGWSTMLKAYKKYGMSPSEYNALPSKTVFSVINSNKPIHMGSYTKTNSGHSTVLRGYTQGVGGDLWYSMIDPNQKSYQTLDIPISAQSDGTKVYYVLNGDKFYWKKARY